MVLLTGVLSQVAAGGASFTDDFNRSDENLEASADWDRLTGSAGSLQVVSNKCDVTANNTVLYECVGLTLADDQYVQVYYDTVGAGTSYVGVVARLSDSSNFYHFRWNDQSNNVQLYKVVAGSFTLLGQTATNSYTSMAGNTLKIECSGTTIEGIVNTTTEVSVTDSAHSSGQGGIRSFDGINELLDDFEMGDL